LEIEKSSLTNTGDTLLKFYDIYMTGLKKTTLSYYCHISIIYFSYCCHKSFMSALFAYTKLTFYWGKYMKKLMLLTSTLALLILAPFTSANGPIDGKLYGKINVSVVNSDSGSTDTWKLNSNASRIGLKGSTQVSEGLTVFYKTEFEVCVDDGDCKGNTIGQRNIYAGVKGSFGSVLAGKNDTPTKLAQKKIDLFNDLEGDIKSTFEGENRISNIVAYNSPNIDGFSATVAVIPSEGSNGNSLNDGMSYSLNYSQDDLYLALASDSDVDGQDLLRLVSQIKINAWQLGLMYQQNEKVDGSLDEAGAFVSAAYKIDNTTYKVQYGAIEDDFDGDEETTLSLGADYKLAKNTKTFVFYTDNTDSSADGTKTEQSTFGIGLEHKF
jgi:predicted porin